MTSEIWPLIDGPSIPREAVELILGLESEGFVVSREVLPGGDRLRVRRADGEPPVLHEDTSVSIKQWKLHLLAVLEYSETR